MTPPVHPIRSMTGFARVRRATPAGELILSLKSLNHRGLDIRFHSPAELEPLENAMRTRIARRLRRGHVEVRASLLRPAAGPAVGLNRPLLEAYLRAFREAAAEFGLPGEPELNTALRIPGMLSETVDREPGPELETALLAALEEALDALNAFREREGEQLARDIQSRRERIAARAEQIAELRSQVLPAFEQRLRERLSDLLAGAAIDPQRLVQEAALLADRSDIGEEIARLKIHTAQLGKLLEEGGEVGKRMDFLLQEMQRETNTLLSKTTGIGRSGLEITSLALATKSDIEKIREQTLNLE